MNKDLINTMIEQEKKFREIAANEKDETEKRRVLFICENIANLVWKLKFPTLFVTDAY